MRFALCLWLSLVALPCLAQHEGFGGAASEEGSSSTVEADDAIPPGDECQVQDDEGRWRSCTEVLAAPARKEQPGDERPPLALPAPPEEDKPAVRKIDETRPARGAFGRAVAGTSEQVKEVFPLLKLRERVAALKGEAEALRQDSIRFREAPAKEEEHRFWSEVLSHVERVGYGKVRSCIASEMPEWTDTYMPPSLYKMTPGGPVYVPEEERRSLPSFDPPGCERIRMVDDDVIEKVRRLHEIRARLRNGGLGYYERDQRRALEGEAKAIEQELGEGGPAPLPKLFKRERAARE